MESDVGSSGGAADGEIVPVERGGRGQNHPELVKGNHVSEQQILDAVDTVNIAIFQIRTG